ncbi:MAG: hypothetical protein KIT22_16590, partial [Verrucomicrobiae bacterium]|nr:hypothetical protein [Verrucomicrobiae bacterium]
GRSIAERAVRTPKEDAKETVKAEVAERKKDSRITPLGVQASGSLQSIGLGPGLGQFSLQRAMVDEQRKAGQTLIRIARLIDQKL